MQKSEFFITSFHYALGGILGNAQTVKAKASDVVEQAWNIAKLSTDRYGQIMSGFDPTVIQMVTAASIPTDATITYTADQTGSVNTTKDVVKESVNPTSVKQPDSGESVAPINLARKS